MNTEEVEKMWQNYWSTGESRWHLGKANNLLVRHLDQLTQGILPEEAGIILVPLSGKSMDLKYLYDQGFKVVAVEFCEQVAREFLESNRIDFSSVQVEGQGNKLVTPDGRLTILCSDIFKVTQEMVGGPVSMVWDRAAIVAIENEDLVKYAQVMKRLIKPGGRYLLVTLHFNQWTHLGPPYNVPPELVRSLFDDGFRVQLLEKVEEGESLKTYLAIPDKELVYLLTAK